MECNPFVYLNLVKKQNELIKQLVDRVNELTVIVARIAPKEIIDAYASGADDRSE